MATTLPDTHFLPRINQQLKDGRFTILRKLGQGVTSTTWLVRDTLARPEKYAAAKILTAEATQELGSLRELDILRAITDQRELREDEEGFDYLPDLYDHFMITGDDTGRNTRDHLCLVLTLYSTSVSALRSSSPEQALPVYMVRSIIYMTLNALDALHSIRIAHTDVKLDNILFSNTRYSWDAALEEFLTTHPPELNQNEGTFSTSQPLPNEWTYETSPYDAERMTVELVNFGHGEFVDRKILGEGLCAPALRPPEVLLHTDITTAIDIWAIGCLTFELLVGRWLFNPEDGGEDWSLEDDHLAKMMELTGHSTFPKDILDRSRLRDKYFDEEGKLRRISDLIPVSVEQAMSNYKIPGLNKEDIEESADFIRACLHLDHTQRKTAKELLAHPFAKKAFSC